MRTSYYAPDTGERARHWSDDAVCKGYDWPDTFFPKTYTGADLSFVVPAARELCNRCPVRGECLSHALTYDEREGIWGGLTPDERRALKANGEREGPRAAA
jgi:WhiB family redox-sensing transcriptional regulator